MEKSFLDKISKKRFSSDNHGKIILDNESHTLGNLISRGLQENKNVDFASYKMDHLLINQLTIDYVTNSNKTINEVLDKTVNNQIKIYKDILSKFKGIK